MQNENKTIDDQIVDHAMEILLERMKLPGDLLERSTDVRRFIVLNISDLEHEVFGAILMDHTHRYITHEVLFRGTLLHTAVSPREIVKYALKHNASKIIFYHNHPSGTLSPSPADIKMTKVLRDILNVIDVEVNDHIIVAGDKSFSFKEGKLL